MCVPLCVCEGESETWETKQTVSLSHPFPLYSTPLTPDVFFYSSLYSETHTHTHICCTVPGWPLLTATVGQLERLKPYAHCASASVGAYEPERGDLYQRNLCGICSHLFAGWVWERESVGGINRIDPSVHRKPRIESWVKVH